jgi:hypothetical protein
VKQWGGGDQHVHDGHARGGAEPQLAKRTRTVSGAARRGAARGARAGGGGGGPQGRSGQGGRAEACPLSTGGGTRRVHLVREGRGGRGGAPGAARRYGGGPRATPKSQPGAAGSARGASPAPRGPPPPRARTWRGAARVRLRPPPLPTVAPTRVPTVHGAALRTVDAPSAPPGGQLGISSQLEISSQGGAVGRRGSLFPSENHDKVQGGGGEQEGGRARTPGGRRARAPGRRRRGGRAGGPRGGGVPRSRTRRAAPRPRAARRRDVSN